MRCAAWNPALQRKQSSSSHVGAGHHLEVTESTKEKGNQAEAGSRKVRFTEVKEARMAESIEATRSALRGASRDLLARRNVIATGVGYKVTGGMRTQVPCMVCSVTRKMPASALAAADLIPQEIQGIATDIVETGRIRALRPPTGRFRPAPGGVSIGHRDITAGTLGCLVRKGGNTFILSNNHVLANSNEAAIGDPILQPGPHDGGTIANDHIANLEAFVPISFVAPEPPSECNFARAVIAVLNAGCRLIGSQTRYRIVSIQQTPNLVDAAIARPLAARDVADEILGIGAIQGTVQGTLGMRVQKSGRTTGLTTGEILQVDVTVNVEYGAGRIAQFTDQLLAGAMSQGGDSGSAVLDDQKRLTGLLFAGSDNTTIINRIEHVFAALGVTR
jgi:hypothetical protein